jgi:hypothetical protein
MIAEQERERIAVPHGHALRAGVVGIILEKIPDVGDEIVDSPASARQKMPALRDMPGNTSQKFNASSTKGLSVLDVRKKGSI